MEEKTLIIIKKTGKFFGLFLFGLFVFASVAFSLNPRFLLGSLTIPNPSNSLNKYAWGENVGWIDFSGVSVDNVGLTGRAYGENIGWISLSCKHDPTDYYDTDDCAVRNYGVTNNNGTLSGYAWSENMGWINFSGVTIDTSTGDFLGYAYGETTGWISFNCLNTNSCASGSYKVSTVWRPCSSNCVSCSATCTECASGYTLVAGACQLCATAHPNCSSCNTTSNDCTGCDSGYTLISGECQACSTITLPHCASTSCGSTSNVCTQCNSGYVLVSGACQLCSTIPNCTSCSTTSNTCLACTSPYIPYAYTGDTGCTTYESLLNPCGYACVSCTAIEGGRRCDVCLQGYHTVPVEHGTGCDVNTSCSSDADCISTESCVYGMCTYNPCSYIDNCNSCTKTHVYYGYGWANGYYDAWYNYHDSYGFGYGYVSSYECDVCAAGYVQDAGNNCKQPFTCTSDADCDGNTCTDGICLYGATFCSQYITHCNSCAHNGTNYVCYSCDSGYTPWLANCIQTIIPVPTGLTATAPSVFGASDGSISGATTAEEYSISGANSFTAVTGTVVTGLPAGSYDFRFAAVNGGNPSPVTTVKVNKGPGNLTTIASVSDKMVANGTEFASATSSLPAVLKVTFSNGSSVNLPVVWAADTTPTYKPATGGTYVLTGTITIPLGSTFKNLSNKKASVNIIVANGVVVPSPFCGDGSCNNSETCSSCPSDCGSCPVISSGGGGGGGAPQILSGNFSVLINSGASQTENSAVTLSIRGYDSNVLKMAVSNFSDLHDAVKQKFTPTLKWNLCLTSACPNGTYTVYVKLFGSGDIPSNVFSDTIVYSATFVSPPIDYQTIPIQNYGTYSPMQNLTISLWFGQPATPQNTSQTKILQQMLAQDKTVYPAGIVSGTFGKLTLQAVKVFQQKYQISGPGQAGYGVAGPKTRAKLNGIYGTAQ